MVRNLKEEVSVSEKNWGCLQDYFTPTNEPDPLDVEANGNGFCLNGNKKDEEGLKPFRGGIQHKSNTLHVYCRLRDIGVSKKLGRFVGEIYEILSKPFLYRNNGRCKNP